MIHFRPMMFVSIIVLPYFHFANNCVCRHYFPYSPFIFHTIFTANCISCFLHIYLLNFMYFTILPNFILKSSKLAISSILAILVLWSGLGPTFFNGLHLKIKGSLFCTLKIFRKFLTPDLAKLRDPSPPLPPPW